MSRHWRRFASFLGVGLVGVVTVNTGLVVLKEYGHLGVYAAAVIAGQVSIGTTFTLNNLVTWRDRQHRRLVHRFGLYELVNLGGLALYVITIALLHGIGHVHYLLAGLCGSGVAALSNYAANHLIVFPFAGPLLETDLGAPVVSGEPSAGGTLRTHVPVPSPAD